jgi:hypothetical protein
MKDLREFMERYLPDYEEKKNVAKKSHTPFYDECFGCVKDILGDEFEFAQKHFLEALSNYTKIICEKQREICQGALDFKDGTPLRYEQE